MSMTGSSPVVPDRRYEVSHVIRMDLFSNTCLQVPPIEQIPPDDWRLRAGLYMAGLRLVEKALSQHGLAPSDDATRLTDGQVGAFIARHEDEVGRIRGELTV